MALLNEAHLICKHFYVKTFRQLLQKKQKKKRFLWKISFALRMKIKCSGKEFFTLTHFIPVSHFYTLQKRRKTLGFLTFSGGIEM